MIEVHPKRKQSLIFGGRDLDDIRPLDDLLSKVNSGRQDQETDPKPTQTRSRTGSVSRLPSLVPHRFGSMSTLRRHPSGVIKPPSKEFE